MRTVRVPMTPPHRTASGVVADSPLVLVDVHTDASAPGHSVIFTYTAAALRPVAELVQNMAPLIQGEPLVPLEIERKLSRRFRLLGTHGLVGMAIAGIDMAVWDALARSHGVSLCGLLGAAPAAVPAYGAVGFDGAAGSAATAEEWAKRGFKAVKAKVGYLTVAEDIEVIRAMRAAAGPSVAIMIDYNQSLTPAEAIDRVRRLEELDLAWVEEPVYSHDFAGHATVAREVRTPIQSGENWWGVHDVRQALDAGASDYIMLDVMKTGGVSGWLRAAALVEAHQVRLSNHLWPEISAQLLGLSPVAHWLEYADWWNPVLKEPLRVVNGLAISEGVSGTGIEWNEEAIARFAA